MTTELEKPSKKVLALVDSALDLQQAGESKRAHELLEDVRRLEPGYPTVHLLLGLSYRDRQEYEQAEASLRQALRLDPEQLEALQALGLILLNHGEPEEGIEVLTQHLHRNPADTITLRALANGLRRLKRNSEALELLKSSWLISQNSEIGVLYANYLTRSQNAAEAEELLLGFIEKGIEQPEVWYELAHSFAIQSKSEEERSTLEKLTTKYPKYAKGWTTRVSAHLRSNKMDEADSVANQALSIDSLEPRNWLSKVQVLKRIGTPDSVLEAVQTGIRCAIESSPTSDVLLQLQFDEAATLLNIGRVQEGLDKFEQLRSRFPTTEDFYLVQIQILVNLGKAEPAVELIKQAFELGISTEGKLAPYNYLILHLLGQHQEAWNFISPLLNNEHRRLMALADIGTNIYQNGQVAASLAVYNQLASYAPSDPRIANNLGFILIGEADFDTAQDYLSLASVNTDEDAEASDENAKIRVIALANLGYLYLVQGMYDEAQECIHRTIEMISEPIDAIQRIAYWHANAINPGFTPHPTRYLSVGLAAKANMVALHQARKEYAAALELATEIVNTIPEQSLGYEVLGWVHLEQEKTQLACESWQKALQFARSSEEKKAYQDWLRPYCS